MFFYIFLTFLVLVFYYLSVFSTPFLYILITFCILLLFNIFNVYQVTGTFLNLSECVLLIETVGKEANYGMEWSNLTHLRTGTMITWYIEYFLFQILKFTFRIDLREITWKVLTGCI